MRELEEIDLPDVVRSRSKSSYSTRMRATWAASSSRRGLDFSWMLLMRANCSSESFSSVFQPLELAVGAVALAGPLPHEPAGVRQQAGGQPEEDYGKGAFHGRRAARVTFD